MKRALFHDLPDMKRVKREIMAQMRKLDEFDADLSDRRTIKLLAILATIAFTIVTGLKIFGIL